MNRHFCVLLLSVVSLRALGCESCKCQGTNPVDLLSSGLNDAYRDALKPSVPAAPQPDASAPDRPLATRPPTPTPTPDASAPTRWYFDTLFEFVSYKHQSVAQAVNILA